jgi:hypothetical protein
VKTKSNLSHRQPHGLLVAIDHDSSSSNAFASVRSRVSKPPVNRTQQFARLLHLVPVAPEAGEAHGGAEFPLLAHALTLWRLHARLSF